MKKFLKGLWKKENGGISVTMVVTTIIMAFVAMTVLLALTDELETIAYGGTDPILTALVPIVVWLVPVACIVGIILGAVKLLKR